MEEEKVFLRLTRLSDVDDAAYARDHFSRVIEEGRNSEQTECKHENIN